MSLVKIKEKVLNGELCFGTHVSNAEPWYYEVCGKLGYDYIWIDNEHAGMSMPMTQNALVATNAGGAAAFVRVPNHEMTDLKPVLECGPDGIIFPMVNTAEEAEHCAKMTMYPPKGTRGFGPLRALDYGIMPLDDYIATADSRILKLMQCETKEAVDNLNEILDVDGVDVIIVGPMDLSASVGKLGKLDDPEVVALMNKVIQTCKERQKPFGLSIGMNLDLVSHFIYNGATFVSLGTPIDYFVSMSKDIIEKVREIERIR